MRQLLVNRASCIASMLVVSTVGGVSITADRCALHNGGDCGLLMFDWS